ncbi:MAG: tyrosine-type recombinase/integrase [Gammaproteobacteria bacterium]|nr:tyrosine-type recombinase/integrase [Gammaproteobacteria bacterium]
MEDRRWHDSRHTWASWHVQPGTPLPVLQKLARWSTIQMLMRYAHLTADHLAP